MVAVGGLTLEPSIRSDSAIRTIVKPLWQLPPSEAKKPSNITQTRNIALQFPKISLKNKGYFGRFKGYIFAVLGQFFAFFCVLGVVGHRGFTIVLKEGR